MSGVLGAILGEGGAALGGATARALGAAAGEAGEAAGANIGRAAGRDIAGKIMEKHERKKACRQAFPDNPEACNDGDYAYHG